MSKSIINYASDESIRERAAEIARACIRKAEAERMDLDTEWAQAERMWARISISTVFPPDEIKHVPEPYNRVETIVPRIYTGIYGVGPWFTVKAHREDYIKQEDALVELINWQTALGDWRYYSDQEDGIRNMAIYGTVVFKDDWYSKTMSMAERAIKKKRYEAQGQLIAEVEEQGDLEMIEETVEYPRARSLDIKSVVLDRYCNNIHDCRYIGDKFEITVFELERRGREENGYQNVEHLKTVHAEGTKKQADAPVEPLDTLRLYELWTTMELNGKETAVAIVIGERLSKDDVAVVKGNTFPGGFPPYQVGRYIKRPGEMYGVGALTPIAESSKELDEWRTLHMRALELAVSPPFVGKDAAEYEGENLYLWPGRVLNSPIGPEGLQAISIPVNQMSAQAMENVMRQDIAQTSRAPDTWMGQTSASRETAFEVGKRLQESGLSLGRIIARYRTEVVKPILRNWLALNHMYLTEDVRIRKLGVKAFRKQPFRIVKPKDIQAQFDFEILDISEVALLGNASREWVNFLRAMPPPMMQVVRWDKTMKNVLKAQGVTDPEQYIYMQPDDEDLLSAGEEMLLIEHLHQPPVFAQHNHIAHISQHNLFKATKQYEEWSPQKKDLLERHMQEHNKQIARLMEQQLKTAERVGLGGMPPEIQQRRLGGRTGALSPETQTQGLQHMAGINQGS